MTDTNISDSSKPRLGSSISATANRLQKQVLNSKTDTESSQARALLAQLRRQAGQSIVNDPLSIDRTLSTLRPGLSPKEIGKGDAPSPSEEAAFQALSLFALHMQSAKKPVHVEKISFASACGKLYQVSDSKSMKLRFDAMLQARDQRSRLIHARSLITLLRSKELSFDYGRFAVDLRALAKPGRREGVLLRWGRDFALARTTEDSDNTPSNS